MIAYFLSGGLILFVLDCWLSLFCVWKFCIKYLTDLDGQLHSIFKLVVSFLNISGLSILTFSAVSTAVLRIYNGEHYK